MNIGIADLRQGMDIRHGGVVSVVLRSSRVDDHAVCVTLRDMVGGRVHEEMLDEKMQFERVHVTHQPLSYLYQEGSNYVFMDSETYDQVVISADIVGEAAVWFKEGSEIAGCFVEGELIGVSVPILLEFTVLSIEPGVSDASGPAGKKRATLENGVELWVPEATQAGESVMVDTSTRTYMMEGLRH